MFDQLDRSEIHQIVDLFLARVSTQLESDHHGCSLVTTDALRNELEKRGYDPTMGARPLRRAVQELVENPLAEFVLAEVGLEPGTLISLDFEDGESVISTLDRTVIVEAEPTPA